jgi:hypothetical protein
VEFTANAAPAKTAAVAPLTTVTVFGTSSAALLELKVTAAPDEPAAVESVTVQSVLAPPASVPGLHDRVLTAVTWTVIAAVSDVLASVAVTVTCRSLFTALVVAANETLVAPASTVTEDGTLRALLLLDSLTAVPLWPAAALSDTMQVTPALAETAAGEQENAERVAVTAVTVTDAETALPATVAVILAV